MRIIKFFLLSLILVGCELPKPKPEFFINGKPYYTIKKCVDGHNESKYDYHYGYSIMYGKFCWHLGSYEEFVCEKYLVDTIEIK